MRKLVRDKIPARMEAEGIDPKVRVCVGPKLDLLLRNKLVEEAKEIVEAQTPEELLEEMADLEAVFFALRRHHDLTSVDVMCRIQEKSRTHGGFQQGFEIEVPTVYGYALNEDGTDAFPFTAKEGPWIKSAPAVGNYRAVSRVRVDGTVYDLPMSYNICVGDVLCFDLRRQGLRPAPAYVRCLPSRTSEGVVSVPVQPKPK